MGKHNYLKAVLVWACLTSLLIPFSVTHAELSKERIGTISAIISYLLLGDNQTTIETPIETPDGQGISIDLNEVIDSIFQASSDNQIFVEFGLQSGEVEFCFDLSSGTAIGANDISVVFNESVLIAIEGKDNCYQFSASDQRDNNFVVIRVNTPNLTVDLARFELTSTNQVFGGLSRLTRGEWDERAVRKVLKIFAFGGHALDTQVQEWADMDAVDAIEEMLTFEKQNSKLSPVAVNDLYQATAVNADLGLFTNWINFLVDTSSDTPIPADLRDRYNFNGGLFNQTFDRMATVRGLNPFRQRIGFWETNFHLAVNRDAGVSDAQVARYYDVIMQAHEDDLPYYQVLGEAAKSAAVAVQYGHQFNQWDAASGECLCNDDFAREIHQLFYGIFGVDDPTNHEQVTIPETGKLLTDMSLLNANSADDDIVVDFGTDKHHQPPVIVFGQSVSGVNAAAKIDNLMPISMQQPESLNNLPVMIISVLADDNLGDAQRDQLRSAWLSLGVNRNFLEFIQAYAVSDLLHSASQRKFFNSHQRSLYLANKNNLENIEAYIGGDSLNVASRVGRTVADVIEEDAAGEFFSPLNNVFGHQTGKAASDSATVFENHFKRQTDSEALMREAASCVDCAGSTVDWEKDWASVLPRRDDGNFYVAEVAEWLWLHAVGNLDNYKELERAHLYALLGTARLDPLDSGANTADIIEDHGALALDFNLMMCVIEDHKRFPRFNETPAGSTILQILTTNRWNRFCRDNNIGNDRGGSAFEQHELDIINKAFTEQEIVNDAEIQSILSLLGDVRLEIEAGLPVGQTPVNDTQALEQSLRLNTLERINSALGFIFNTPFIFAEGQ